jgi:putative ABC transport system permease protein
MKSYTEISNRYMKENKKRTVLTVLGITLATVLIFAVGTFLLSFRDTMVASERANGDFEFRINNINSEQANKVINNAEVKDSSVSEIGEQYSISGSDRVINLEKGNKDYFQKIYTQKTLEGREPEAEDEAIIDINVKNILNLKVGDQVVLKDKDLKEKKVTIVGISEAGMYSSSSALEMSGYFDSSNLSSVSKYFVYVNIKSDSNKQEIIKNVLADANIEKSDDTIKDNNEILYLTGNGAGVGITEALRNMAIFVIVVIMVCTISVIYNSFNISVIERIKYFGILKAIGTTPKQIVRIIFKEGAIMGLLALPIGCIVGFFALKFGIKLFIGDSLLFVDNFTVHFYPSILLLTIVLVSVTILISVLGPARKAKKVSPVEAMRNTNEIKLGKLKRRKGRLIQKVFGIEGSMAYKNIRRTPARFIITVLALTISLIMFNIFYGFLDYTKQVVSQLYGNTSFDSGLTKVNQNEKFTDDEIKEIKDNVQCYKNYYFYQDLSNIAIPVEGLNQDYTNKTGKATGDATLDSLGFRVLPSTTTYVGEENELSLVEPYIVEGKLDYQALKNGGIILIDGQSITNGAGDKEIIRATSYKVGDKIKIPKITNYSSASKESSTDNIEKAIKNNEFYEAPIVAIAEKDPLSGQFLFDGIQIMADKESYNKTIGGFSPNTIYFDFNNDKETQEHAVEYFDKVQNGKGYNYIDIGTQLNQIDTLYSQVEFFVYCFIIIVTVISVVNIFNTISTNLLLRKKEFATLKAIGMEERQLRKSVVLEGTLYGIIAAIFGGALSAILLALLIKLGGGLADVDYHFGYIPFIISIIVAIGITYISTLIPLRRLRKITIVEGIADNE